MKKLNLVRAALIGVIATYAAALYACSEAPQPAPTETAVATRMARSGPYQKVLLQAVAAPNGTVNSGVKVLYLRPVKKGEPLPQFEN